MSKKISQQMLVTLLLGAVAAVSLAGEPAEVDKDGLHLIHESELRVVYARPGVDFSQYSKVILVDAYVAFRKNWRRKQNETDPFKVSKRDVEEIKKRVGDTFHAAFAEELEKKGIQVMDAKSTGQDVLVVRPAIINLDVSAPDTNDGGMRQTVAASAGQMTFYAEMYDSVSSELIARVVDPQADHSWGGQFMPMNRVTNKAAEVRIVKKWADILAGHLHHVTSNP